MLISIALCQPPNGECVPLLYLFVCVCLCTSVRLVLCITLGKMHFRMCHPKCYDASSGEATVNFPEANQLSILPTIEAGEYVHRMCILCTCALHTYTHTNTCTHTFSFADPVALALSVRFFHIARSASIPRLCPCGLIASLAKSFICQYAFIASFLACGKVRLCFHTRFGWTQTKDGNALAREVGTSTKYGVAFACTLVERRLSPLLMSLCALPLLH